MAIIYGIPAKNQPSKRRSIAGESFKPFSSEQEKIAHENLTSKIHLERKKLIKDMKKKEELRIREQLRQRLLKEVREEEEMKQRQLASAREEMQQIAVQRVTTHVERVTADFEEDSQPAPQLASPPSGGYIQQHTKRIRVSEVPKSSSNKENNDQSIAPPFPGLSISQADEVEPDRPVAPDQYTLDELVSLLQN